MRKLFFVNPSTRQTIFGRMKFLALPPIGLGLLASRTPPGYDIAIVDENVDEIDFDASVDLVAVTATTVQAPRAYQIIEQYKARGVTTIIGGIHASVRPDEASRYADSVVIGEADDMWLKVLKDYESGNLQKVYKVESFPSLENAPPIDRGLFSKKYALQSVQTSRGCPCNCNFCSVTKFNGSRYRFRPVREVIAEIERLGVNRLFIADDSVVGLGRSGIDHARELFTALKGLGKTWGSQVCITIAEHEDLLKAAAASGANTFYIGFESVEAGSLEAMNKSVNLRPAVKGFKDAIRKIHDHGIGVIGGFILGSDFDTKDIFKRTADFILETGIDGCQFTIMTPFPGTALYERMQRENRLLYTSYPDDWSRYNAYELVIRPKNMTIHELVRGQMYLYDATSTLAKSAARSVKTLVSTGSPINAAINFSWNYSNYRAIKAAF